MPRGLPDYYNPDTLVSQRLANVEEIVTALRGVPSLDNRGRTIFFDNFKDGVAAYYLTSGGDGSDAVADTSIAEVPPNSLYFECGTDAGSGSSTAWRIIRSIAAKKVGFEVSIGFTAALPDITCMLRYDDGDNQLEGRWELDGNNGIITVWDVNTPKVIATMTAEPGRTGWLPIKIVLDFENRVYTRCLVGLSSIDVSDYSLRSIATAYEGQLSLYLNGTAQDDATNEMYVGHIAITADEP